jgi:ferrous iron transport protein A
MESTIFSKLLAKSFKNIGKSGEKVTNLAKAQLNNEYVIKEVKTDDEEIKNFLFTLGCYEGEKITVISKLADNFVISVKDSRYSIDKELAEAIEV